jgi:carboxylate-amine ligase
MPLEPFKPSQALTMGVELELQLIDLSTFDLSASSSDLLHLLGRRPFPGTVTPEITESMIEISTAVHTGYEGLARQLRDIRDVLAEGVDALNVGISGGGTHPFQHWPERLIFPKPRFREISHLYGYLAKQFTIFGQHVHIGCRSGDEALSLLHALSRYIPQFIALSASSPYSQGADTQFESSRLNSVFAFPLSGRAPYLLSWTAFCESYFSRMERTGVVKSMKDFYWDIRPKPEFGTIELRVCDTPLSVDRAAALACYLQAICSHLLSGSGPSSCEDDYLVYSYNRFQACRFGLDGTVVDPSTNEARSIREDVLRTVRLVEPHADSLGSLPALDHIQEIVRTGGDALYLRGQFQHGESLESVVNAALMRFR